mgnify:CR=1 FL=1
MSFASSERNKINVEDFLVLKKKNSVNVRVGGHGKYKVIAIENEVPENVKKVRKSIGFLFDGGNYIGNNEEGYPMDDGTFFTIQSSAVTTVLGEEFNENSVSNFAVRFRGEGQTSSFYDITKVTVPTGNTKHFFYIDGKFGSDVDFMTAHTGDVSNAISTATVDFYSSEIENRPEFDGRFFVKVGRDSELDASIIPLSDQVLVSQTFPVAYINNNAYSNHVRGTLMPDEPQSLNWSTADDGSLWEYEAGGSLPDAYKYDLGSSAGAGAVSNGTAHQHPTEFGYHSNNPENGSDTPSNNNSRYFWNQSDASGNSGFGSEFALAMAGKVRENPIEALNDDFAGGCEQYWRKFGDKHWFFIDGASAYSWTSFNATVASGSNSAFEVAILDTLEGTSADGTQGGFQENIGDNYPYFWYKTILTPGEPYTNYWNTNVELPSIYKPRGGENPEISDETSNAYNNRVIPVSMGPNIAASMVFNKGLPSRAIRDTIVSTSTGDIEGSYMDISWTGMGSGLPGTINDTDVAASVANLKPQVLAQVTSESVEGEGDIFARANTFISTLIVEGARFRFQQDPDEIIYTVRDYGPTEEGYLNPEFWKPDTSSSLGAFGIKNYGFEVDKELNRSIYRAQHTLALAIEEPCIMMEQIMML